MSGAKNNYTVPLQKKKKKKEENIIKGKIFTSILLKHH